MISDPPNAEQSGRHGTQLASPQPLHPLTASHAFALGREGPLEVRRLLKSNDAPQPDRTKSSRPSAPPASSASSSSACRHGDEADLALNFRSASVPPIAMPSPLAAVVADPAAALPTPIVSTKPTAGEKMMLMKERIRQKQLKNCDGPAVCGSEPPTQPRAAEPASIVHTDTGRAPGDPKWLSEFYDDVEASRSLTKSEAIQRCIEMIQSNAGRQCEEEGGVVSLTNKHEAAPSDVALEDGRLQNSPGTGGGGSGEPLNTLADRQAIRNTHKADADPDHRLGCKNQPEEKTRRKMHGARQAVCKGARLQKEVERRK